MDKNIQDKIEEVQSKINMLNKKRLPDILKLLLDNREEMMKWGGEIKVILKDRDDPKKKHLIVEKQ